MSKNETPLTRRYWQEVGGTLVEEFPVVRASPTCGPRYLDGLILPNGPFRLAAAGDVSVEGEDVVVVQTKVGRLGMYLMGQAVFSAALMKRFGPRSVRSVALCTKDDSVLHPLLAPFSDVEVVILDSSRQTPASPARS